MPLTIPSSILSRIVAVRKVMAALDDCRLSAISGINLSFTPYQSAGKSAEKPATLTLTATDGKLLVEETHRLPDDTGEIAAPFSFIVHPEAIPMLAAFAKGVGARRSLHLIPPTATGQPARVEAMVPAGSPAAGGLDVKTWYGTYPRTDAVWDTGADRFPARRFALDARYLAAFADLWAGKRGDSNGMVLEPGQNCIFIHPLGVTDVLRRGLIMRIALPD